MMLTARLHKTNDGRLELQSPTVGLWREQPPIGSLVYGGAIIGRIEVLGELHVVHAPEGARGLVVAQGGDRTRSRRPVGFDELLLTLDPEVAAAALGEDPASSSHAETGLAFRAPSSGRFYARPAPDKALFVSAGETVATGQTVAILEVMKTFNRVQYGGAGLPDKARVIRVVPSEGDDLSAGDTILELEKV